MKFHCTLLAAFIGVLPCACISISPSDPGDDLGDESGSESFFTACVADDYECYGDNLKLMDENFDNIELVAMSAELPSTEASGDFAPAISGYTPEIVAIVDEPLQLLELDWTDPSFSTPSFCLSLCPLDARCDAKPRCTRSIPDGLAYGTWRAYIYYTAFPDGITYTTQELELTVTPMVSLTDEDPIDIIEEGTFSQAITDVKVGAGVTIPQQILGPAEEDDGEADNTEDTGDAADDAADALSCTSSYACTSGRCLSKRHCTVSGNDCECEGFATPGQCQELAGVSCSGSGGVCDDGAHACCVGYSCNNGTCEDAGGQCPF